MEQKSKKAFPLMSFALLYSSSTFLYSSSSQLCSSSPRKRGSRLIMLFLLCFFLFLPIHSYSTTSEEDRIIEFMEAAAKNDKTKVKSLLAEGIDVNVIDNNGMTALMHAAKAGYAGIIEELLKNVGINVNIIDNKCMTAYTYAIQGGHTQPAGKIENEGADINAPYNCKPVISTTITKSRAASPQALNDQQTPSLTEELQDNPLKTPEYPPTTNNEEDTTNIPTDTNKKDDDEEKFKKKAIQGGINAAGLGVFCWLMSFL